MGKCFFKKWQNGTLELLSFGDLQVLPKHQAPLLSHGDCNGEMASIIL